MIETSGGVGGRWRWLCSAKCVAVRLRWLEHHSRTIVGGWWTQRLCHKDIGADRISSLQLKPSYPPSIDCHAESGTLSKSEATP